MRRVALFLLLLAVFVALTFPHDLVVRRILDARLPQGVTASFANARPSLSPLGYRVQTVAVSSPPFRAAIDSLRVGFRLFGGIVVAIDACGGQIEGLLSRSADAEGRRTRDLSLRFEGVDPSRCLEFGGPVLGGRFAGVIEAGAIGKGAGDSPASRLAKTGRFALKATDGTLSGYLPASGQARPSGKQREAQPIGQWEFSSLTLEGELGGGRVTVTRGQAEAEGVIWETKDAVVSLGTRPRVDAEIRARRADESPRSKAILAVLPKAAERQGWRHYRVSGALSSVQVAGIK